MSKEYSDEALKGMSHDELVELAIRQQEDLKRIPANFYVWAKEHRGIEKAAFEKMSAGQQLALVNSHEFALGEQRRNDDAKARARRPAPQLPMNIAELPDGDLKDRLTLDWINRESAKAAGIECGD